MSNVTFDFTGRTVVVTGAARGVGFALAERFQQSGADIFLVDADAEAVGDAASKIGATAIPADVTSTEQVESVVARVVQETGRLDVVVNNAGLLRDRMLWRLADDDWELVLRVHAGGTFKFTRAAVPHFQAQHYGRVINVTSYTGLHGNVGQSNYAAAKAGIIGFTKTAAKELARFGATVNAVSPNADTRMIESIPPDRRAEIEAMIPLGRFGDAKEIAGAVAFLASEEAGYITGAILPVDGGISM
jgi:3-oxoacyl-[acyl-carrier protein] reductase